MSWKYFTKSKPSKERAFNIIRSPITTEKSTLMSVNNQLMFNVSMDANKAEIKSAIEQLFDVKVAAVNTLIRKGKTRRFRNRKGQLSDQKKAFVTLAEGQSLDISTGI